MTATMRNVRELSPSSVDEGTPKVSSVFAEAKPTGTFEGQGRNKTLMYLSSPVKSMNFNFTQLKKAISMQNSNARVIIQYQLQEINSHRIEPIGMGL